MYKILRSTEAGGVQELELKDLCKGCWIDIVDPSDEELAEIMQATNIREDFLKPALDDDEKSRIEIEDDQMLIITDIPILRANNDYETVPLAIIATENYTVTVCLEPNRVTADFGEHNAKAFATYKRTRFIIQILYKSATLYLRYIRTIIKRTDDLEKHIRQSQENKDLFSLLDLQNSMTYFSTSLRSNSIVMERLMRLRTSTQTSQIIRVYEEDEDLLEDAIIEYKQALEMVEMTSHILNNIIEVSASLISNNLNRVMKLLASLTIILAIPTLISGLWGMNVTVPFAENPYGFVFVLGGAVTLAVCAAVLLYKKDML
ncbi:MAG: magnesium transporter CorA family protein [Phascolarctobacterium sp.]|nr:magnesium transporter CorA family protein [Phascolarctobacterium sp.]